MKFAAVRPLGSSAIKRFVWLAGKAGVTAKVIVNDVFGAISPAGNVHETTASALPPPPPAQADG